MKIAKDKREVPIWRKLTLSLSEAAELSGFGIGLLKELTDSEDCDFVVFKGTHRYIKRKKLEEFIDKETTRYV